MPRDSLGNYTLPVGNPVIPGTVPSSTVHNATMADLGAEIQDSLSRSGKGGMTGPFYFADGSEANPSATFTNEATSGLYRAGAGDVRVSVGGNDIVGFLYSLGVGYFNSLWGRFRSAVADGATAIAWVFDTYGAYTTAGAKLLSLQNNAVEKFSVDKDGVIGSRTSLPAATVATSTGTTNFSGTATTFTSIAGLSLTFTNSGQRPFWIGLQGDGLGSNLSYIGGTGGGSVCDVHYRLVRDTDGYVLAEYPVIGPPTINTLIPPGAIWFLMSPGDPGTNTYHIEYRVYSSSTAYAYYCRLVAIEM